MIRHTLLLIAWLAAACLAISTTAHANTFSATYTELARSPANFATTWYDGAVTRDGKFIYGLGNSHNAHGNNGLWLYDPATKTWAIPPHVAQTSFGYVTNGVLDPDKDQIVQIIDRQALPALPGPPAALAGDTINLTVPGLGTYPLRADRATSTDLRSDIRRAAMKSGSRN